MKKRTPRPFRPLLEALEDRLTPSAAGNVTTSLVSGNLTLTGDSLNNSITISETGGQLVITPNANTTLDGNTVAESITVSGSLTLKLGAGNDSVTFDLTNPITINGSLSIAYGSSGTGNKLTKTINGTGGNNFTVGQNIAIQYAAGADTTTLDNLNVGTSGNPKSGNVTITHGAGDSTTTIDNVDTTPTFSDIRGSLSVTNTQGVAENALTDTNVGSNVTFNNGMAGAGNTAGFTDIYNIKNTTTRATIGGNVAISNQSGNGGYDFLGDVSVGGNATINMGSGSFETQVTGFNVPTPTTTIHGNLSISGTGSDLVTLGVYYTGRPPSAVSSFSDGLNVNGNLNVGLSGAGSDTLDLTSVVVGKNTTVNGGNGADSITINDVRAATNSVFNGSFNLTTGAGNDVVQINGTNTSGSASVTFAGPVSANLGAGDDSLYLADLPTTGVGVVNFTGPLSDDVDFNGGTGTNHVFFKQSNITGQFPAFQHFLNG